MATELVADSAVRTLLTIADDDVRYPKRAEVLIESDRSGVRLEVRSEDLDEPETAQFPAAVWLELYRGELRVHVYSSHVDGTAEEPAATIKLARVAPLTSEIQLALDGQVAYPHDRGVKGDSDGQA